MNFSDDDLKRLKDKLASGPGEIVMLIVSAYELQALLARLEAAELCKESLMDLLNHGLEYENGSTHQADPELAKRRIEAWCKAAGK